MNSEPRQQQPPTEKPHLNPLFLGVPLPFRLIRFAGVGALSGLIYVLAVAFYVDVIKFDVKLSSVLGYLTALPVSFIGHRNFTFRSNGQVAGEFVRFLVVHGANIAISIGGMALIVDWFGYNYWFGSILAVALVPISTYIVMEFWVFPGSDCGT